MVLEGNSSDLSCVKIPHNDYYNIYAASEAPGTTGHEIMTNISTTCDLMCFDVFFFIYHADVSFYIKLEIKSSSYIILMFTSSTPLAIFDNKIAQWCSQITTTLRTTPPRPPRSHNDIWRERKDRYIYIFFENLKVFVTDCKFWRLFEFLSLPTPTIFTEDFSISCSNEKNRYYEWKKKVFINRQ